MPSDKDMEKLKKDLQKLVGSSPKIKVAKFTNWAKNLVIEHVLECHPTEVSEVQAVIKGARDLGLQVRAAGRTHSWTPLFSDEGQVVIYVRDLKRPDGPQLELLQNENGNNSVTMATGVNTGELRDFLLSHGVTIPANVILRVVQMGGVVSPACHGVGFDTQTVSDNITSMRIIDCNGDLRTYSMDEDPDMMRAIQCNLGLWGIIVDFTIKVDPMVIVEADNQWIPVKDLFYNKEAMHKIITENWSVEMFWFPFNGISRWEAFEAFMEKEIDCGEWDPKEDEVWIKVINKPDKVGEVLGDKCYERLDVKSWFESKGYKFADDFITSFPQIAPIFVKAQRDMLKTTSIYTEKIYQQLPHAIHFKDYIEDIKVYDMEWAFSLEDDCSNLMRAVQGVVELVHKEALAGRFPMNFPLEIRYIADSEAYMAPAICANPEYGGTGHTCYIEVLTAAGTPHWQDFSEQVADIWKPLKGARPHWCKEWSHLPGIDEFIREAYSPQIPKFISALERSEADPDGMFFNKRLEGLFYPGGHPGRAAALAKGQSHKEESLGRAAGAGGACICNVL